MNVSLFQLATSICFSWANATVLLLGMQIMQERGLTTFLLWGIPNALCLAIFGFLYHRKWVLLFPSKLSAIYNLITKSVMILMQVICLLLQLKLLQNYFSSIVGEPYSYIVSSLLTSCFVLVVYKKGLYKSIQTDVYQGWITILSVWLFVIYCGIERLETYEIPTSTTSDITWGLWASSVYVFSIINDLQHWRRADIDRTGKAFYLASAIFVLLLVGIALLSQFVLPAYLQLFLIIPVLGLATSTIDSIAVAMHECFNKFIGTGICLALCAFWWVFDSSSFVIWNSLGAVRILGAILIILGSVYYYRLVKNEKTYLL